MRRCIKEQEEIGLFNFAFVIRRTSTATGCGIHGCKVIETFELAWIHCSDLDTNLKKNKMILCCCNLNLCSTSFKKFFTWFEMIQT